MRVTESRREPKRDRARARESQIESAGAREEVTESHREPEGDRERASDTNWYHGYKILKGHL